MNTKRMTAVVVTLYAGPEVTGALERLVEGTAFRLDSIEDGPVSGSIRCLFVRRSETLMVGAGNLVDLVHRIHRNFDVHGAHRVDEAVTA